MRRITAFLVGLSIFTISSGAALYSFFLTPLKENISLNFSCPPGTGNPSDFKIRAIHRWSQGMVVLYSGLCLSHDQKTPTHRVFGHKVIKRSSIGWQPGSSDVYMSTPLPASEQLVEYSIGKSLKGDGDRYTILYGQVLDPKKVVAVEATFDNGKTVRTKSIDGVFGLIATGANSVCELRVIGTDNQVLKRDNLAKLYQLSPKKRFEPMDCLPGAIQL